MIVAEKILLMNFSHERRVESRGAEQAGQVRVGVLVAYAMPLCELVESHEPLTTDAASNMLFQFCTIYIFEISNGNLLFVY